MSIRTDQIDARLLELLQREFPVVSRPFDVIAEALAIPAAEVIARIGRLKSESVIRQISAIFDSSALGYRSTLAAFEVEAGSLEDVANHVAARDGVSHCYSRDARFSLWFTMTVGPHRDLEQEIGELARLEGVKSALILPALRVFKIGVFLRMTGDEAAEADPPTRGVSVARADLTSEDRAAVRALQQDLPLVETPFVQLAEQAGMTEEEILRRARAFIGRGIMRRFAAVLRHRQAGYRCNAMVCWLVAPDAVVETGRSLASDPSVSHCYERPVCPDWPYPLYTMIHSRTESELVDALERLARLARGADHLVLRTVKEYKKSRVLYFAEDQGAQAPPRAIP